MRFLIDAQLPPALCQWFAENGFAAEHVMTRLSGQTPDHVIADYAADGHWVLVTKDDDFRFRFPPIDYQLLWLRCGNVTNRALRSWLADRWPNILAQLQSGEQLVEVR